MRADYGAPYRENLAIGEHEVRRQSLVESKEMVILMSRERDYRIMEDYNRQKGFPQKSRNIDKRGIW